MVLAGWQSPGAKRQTQEGVAGWPDFDPDFAEESGLVEPYLSTIRFKSCCNQIKFFRPNDGLAICHLPSAICHLLSAIGNWQLAIRSAATSL